MKKLHLVDAYSPPGFTPYRSFETMQGKYDSRVVELKRNQKKRNVRSVANLIEATMTKN
jgi:hypothetical protein